MSPLFAYSRHVRTPWCSSRLIVGSGVVPAGLRKKAGAADDPLGSDARTLPAEPGAEIEPVMNATPTGSNASGGRAFAASPAQKLCRSPETVAKPVMPASRTRS